MALVRLDGQYGDASVVAQIMLANVHVVTRGRGYQLLAHPQIQRVLAHPPTARVSRMNTAEVVELFDGGWLPLGEGLPHVRVIVARHPAPAAGKSVTVGKRIDEWVYELFLTGLDADGLLAEDILDPYHGRGAEDRRAHRSAMLKSIQIAGVPPPRVGKNCGKLPVNGCGTCASRL
jgi:hypothetical protein